MERRVSSQVDVVIGSKKLDQQAAPSSEQSDGWQLERISYEDMCCDEIYS
jgi:hypothetical protein